MFGYIYKTTNLINLKIYVGKKHTSTFLGNDYLGSGTRLHSAIACYGVDSFNVELIDTANSLEELNEKERYWIQALQAQDPEIGYNISDGGDGVSGVPAWNKGLNKELEPRLAKSIETKQRHSVALVRAYAEGRRTPISGGYTARKRTEEENLLNSERLKDKRWMYLELEGDIVDVTTPFKDEIEHYLMLGYQFGRGDFHTHPWNEGKTKDTDESLKQMSESRLLLFQQRGSIGCFGLKGKDNKNSTYKQAQEISNDAFRDYWYEYGQCATMKHYNIGPCTYSHCCEILNIVETPEHRSYIRSKSRKKK